MEPYVIEFFAMCTAKFIGFCAAAWIAEKVFLKFLEEADNGHFQKR